MPRHGEDAPAPAEIDQSPETAAEVFPRAYQSHALRQDAIGERLPFPADPEEARLRSRARRLAGLLLVASAVTSLAILYGAWLVLRTVL